MKKKRLRKVLFCTLQLLRQDMRRRHPSLDWKDVDNYIFASLDLEIGELEEIYGPYHELVYGASCYEDGHSPKDFDEAYKDI